MKKSTDEIVAELKKAVDEINSSVAYVNFADKQSRLLAVQMQGERNGLLRAIQLLTENDDE